MESFCRREFGPRSRPSARVVPVVPPSPKAEGFGPNSPGPPVARRLCLRKDDRHFESLSICKGKSTGRVSRWRAPALSGGLGRTTGTPCAALLADRLAIGETELFPSKHERL